MFGGVPAVYATFASYDEVAHHSGLERADTLEALRKLDARFRPHRTGSPLRAAAVRRSSCCPTTARLRGRRFASATATDSTTSSSSRLPRAGSAGWPPATRTRPACSVPSPRRPAARRSARPSAAATTSRPGRRRARLGQPRARLPHGAPAPPHARGDPQPPPAAHGRAVPAPPHGVLPRALPGRRGAGDRRRRDAPARRRPRDRTGSACELLAQRGAAPAARGRLPARRRHRRQQLLRPGDRGGVRVSRSSSPSMAGSASPRPGRSCCAPVATPRPRSR